MAPADGSPRPVDAATPATPRTRWRRLALLLVLAAGLVAFFALGGPRWLSLEALQQHRALLLQQVDRHYAPALVAAIVLYTAATALSVPGAVVLTLAMGLLFGRWVGTAAVVLAATLGATLVFLAARYLFADAARRRLRGRAERLAQGFGRDAFHYLLFLRLVPLFPFWLVNLVPAFTPIPLRTYVAATALGIVPGSFVYANLGQSLGRVQSADELVSPAVLLALGLLGLLSLVPVVLKRARRSVTPAPEV